MERPEWAKDFGAEWEVGTWPWLMSIHEPAMILRSEVNGVGVEMGVTFLESKQMAFLNWVWANGSRACIDAKTPSHARRIAELYLQGFGDKGERGEGTDEAT